MWIFSDFKYGLRSSQPTAGVRISELLIDPELRHLIYPHFSTELWQARLPHKL